MNKEELEKEAQRSFDELDDWCVGDDWSIEESYKNGYSNGAEPREKRIAELEHQLTHRNCLDCSNHSSNLRMRNLDLEKENEQIKNSDTLCKLIGEQKRKITDLEEKLANADYQLEGRDLEIKELEKENAELIQENEEMKKGLGCETCQIHLEYMRLNNKIDELEKENAELKELIKNIIRVTWEEGWNYSLDWKVKAEQFLSEEEK